ncbi:MAG: DUF368 domain-containing protein [Bacteroidia bacterium]
MKNAREFIMLFFKGVAMGAANVIPGVSGGTIAFITGIYDKLIESLKRLDIKAVRLFITGKFKEFANYVNLGFLVFLFLGIGISIVSLGKLLKWLFEIYPIEVWAFFFGLIVASVYSVGKAIKKWNASSIGGILFGTAVAIALAFLKPATESTSFIYLILCGVVAICSMLLPGLSGSFVLILMGNYQLIMLTAIPEGNFSIIVPVAIGALIGFIALSHFISYMLRKHEMSTIGTLTGFILGSLLIIWPWKSEVFLKDEAGAYLIKEGEKIVMGYEWFLPSFSSSQTIISIALMIVGAALVILLDKFGNSKGQVAN